MKAERETADRLIAHFLADRVGATFDGHISGVTRAGLFVELDETGADGFMPARYHRRRIFPLSGSRPRLRRQRGDLSARRRGHCRIGRGGAGRRRLALQAGAGRSCRVAAADDPRAARAAESIAFFKAAWTTRQDFMSDDVETTVPGGRLIDPNEGDRGVSDDTALPYLRPKDSATLILIDRSEPVPKVLLGRRHSRHKFVPGKFVFPGGRVEVSDRQMPFAAPLHERHTARLLYKLKRPSAAKAAAYALAAIRETYEETGLMLGTRARGTDRRAGRPLASLRAGTTSCPTSAPSISSPAPSRRRTGRGVSTAASSLRTFPPSPTGPTALSGPTPNWWNWSGCRSPRRAGSTCRASPRSCSKTCATASAPA